MRSVVGVLIAFAATSSACICSSSIDLDRELMEVDAAVDVDPDGAPDDCVPAEWTKCSGECVDTDSHHDHCGDCVTACARDFICVAGVCERECPGEMSPCPDRCVDLTRDKDNCGDCGVRCEHGGHCVDSQCD